MQILIVEDEEKIANFIRRGLLEESYAVDTAKDGEEALAAVKAMWKKGKPYQLICLDIMMPTMDGHGFLKLLRQFEEECGTPPGKAAKVVMTTCLDDNLHIMDSFREQCDAYIVKPIGGAKLMEQLAILGLAEPSSLPAGHPKGKTFKKPIVDG